MTTAEIILGMVSAMGVGGGVVELVKRFNPTRQEKTIEHKTVSEFQKTFREAQYVEFQLTEQLKKMVAEETKLLRTIIVENEIKHKVEQEETLRVYTEKLEKAEGIIEGYALEMDKVRKRNGELEKKVEVLEKKIAILISNGKQV